MKKILFIGLFLAAMITKAQNINQYKYVVIPEKFEFLKDTNQYQMNALTKFLFKKYGFTTYMKNEKKPKDLITSNACDALNARIIDNSGWFVTKLVVALDDCYGNTVFKSEEGSSREKDFKTAYHEALRQAFVSINSLDYKYDPNTTTENTVASARAKNQQQTSTAKPVEQPEVATKEPAVQKQEQYSPAAQPETKTASAEIKNTAPHTKKTYMLAGDAYYLQENGEGGYALYQKGMSQPFAALVKSQGSDNFMYTSVTKQGMAYFDQAGNLVIENFDRNQGKAIKTVYKLQE